MKFSLEIEGMNNVVDFGWQFFVNQGRKKHGNEKSRVMFGAKFG